MQDFYGLATVLNQNDAGSALGGVAADMGTGEAEIFAQQLHQKRARIDIDACCGFTVHSQGNGCHKRLLGFPKNVCYAGGLRPFSASKVENATIFARFPTLELELL